jgi:hypothetical protein
MAREKVTFPIGTPVVVQIESAGVLKPGSSFNGGDEYQYICDGDSRIMWVSPELAAQIEAARPISNEIAITKFQGKGRGRPITWEVEPVQDDTAYSDSEPAAPSQPVPTQAAPPPVRTAPRSAPPPPMAMGRPGEPRAPLQPVPPIPTPTLLIESLYLAVQAAANAEAYAVTVLGRAIQFSAEDIRVMANTQCINGPKGGR